jgi:poly(A) polymerase
MSDRLGEATNALRALVPHGFYVGGCVRDWLLGRTIKDLDIAVPDAAESQSADKSSAASSGPPVTEVEALGRKAAQALGGSFFWLREGMGVARIIVKDEPPLQIDLVPLAGSLEEDLRRRDFTLNAMAVRVADGLVAGAPVIDPTGGREDLAQRWLRLAAPDALERDPLRCLRAFRFRTALGLTFAPEMVNAVHAASSGLVRISGERIRDELFVLLEGAHSPTVVADLLAYNLVAPWSPALAASAAGDPLSSPHHLFISSPDQPSAGIDAARALDAWLAHRAPQLPCAADLAATLESMITPPRSRRALTRLAALSIRAGSDVTSIGHALALSANETRTLTRAVGGASALREAWPLPGRGHLRFSQQWEPGAVEAVLLTLAASAVSKQGTFSSPRHQNVPVKRAAESQQPTTDMEPLESLLSDLLERRLRPQPPLLVGQEIMAILGVTPGPEVGRHLQQIEERRADGILTTPDDAREWLRKRREEAGGEE